MAKAYSYNAWVAPRHICCYHAACISADFAASSTFDCFDDACQVGGALYFSGQHQELIRKAKLYVGTPFSAGSAAFIWEVQTAPNGDWDQWAELKTSPTPTR